VDAQQTAPSSLELVEAANHLVVLALLVESFAPAFVEGHELHSAIRPGGLGASMAGAGAAAA
jgi:hypothetical protein